MKKTIKRELATLLVLPVVLTAFSVTTHASWLDQGADLFKQAQEKIDLPDNIIPPSLSNQSKNTNLSIDDIQNAFKEALSKGSETVVNQLSLKGGFNNDPKIHIPLPDSLKTVQSTLKSVGMSHLMDDLETKLNQAAEAATPQAKSLFLTAIKEISFKDIQDIYNGPKDSATQYLKAKTSNDLKSKMAPIIEQSLNDVGAINAYDKAISSYKNLPFVPDVKANLLDHVVQKGMDGMFFYLAQEEASIRQDPVKQSTELLKKVFGQ
ncbi:MAG: DUF4197 domain-containing protein [Thiomicrorhabdus sp.]|nr:DUF4197 domain-containing protein [Thiomicrorhabdus sp.]